MLTNTVAYDCSKTNAKKGYHSHNWVPIDKHLEELQNKRATETVIYVDRNDTFSSNEIEELYQIRNLWTGQVLEICASTLIDDPTDEASKLFDDNISTLFEKEFIYTCRELIVCGISTDFAEKAHFFSPKVIKITEGDNEIYTITPVQLWGVLSRLENTPEEPILSVEIAGNFAQFFDQIREFFLNSTSTGTYNVVIFQCDFGDILPFTENRGNQSLELKVATETELLELFGDDAPKLLGYPPYLLQRTSRP
ncbi:hypothetical protein Ddc_16589 [Ditylenchus destructor]|nr:hypothetical protein Ddc_16589 [Ditylenchus destructor]